MNVRQLQCHQVPAWQIHRKQSTTATVQQERCCRLKELEAAAEQLQAALLAELDGPLERGGASSKKKRKAKKGKKKQVRTVQAATDTVTLSCCSAVI